MAPKRNTTRRGKDRVINVRSVDDSAGSDGLHVDRMITSLQVSESQIRVLCGESIDVSAQPSPSTYVVGATTVQLTDDFISMQAQFQLYRIKAIKFDIYDINPNVPVFNSWSTFHESATASSTFTRAQITDGPDSRSLSGGTGRTTLYWVAHGVEENRFQSTASTASPNLFGGLRYYVGPAGVATGKYEIIIHAVVDFRGRV